MKKFSLLFLIGFMLMSSCAAPKGVNVAQVTPTISSQATELETLTPLVLPKIDRKPAPRALQRKSLDVLPNYDPNSTNPFQIDLRSAQITKMNMTKATHDQLAAIVFDSLTVFPPKELLSKDYDPVHVMELGKNPGLGIRGLHQQGITGKHVGIAILDQQLLVDHEEYKNQLMFYEEINVSKDSSAQMHGPAVASIAVGRTAGVAPEADLYFIADWFVDKEGKVDFNYLAQGIYRILEINTQLPQASKVRVISISRGLSEGNKGYDEVMKAIKTAEDQGVLVLTVFKFGIKTKGVLGLYRDYNADPDLPASYIPAPWVDASFAELADQLWIPIGSRSTASQSGIADWAHYGEGGMSWAEPHLAGVYALACQVKPDITPEKFWEVATKTGTMSTYQLEGKQIEFGPIINPPALIEALQKN